MSSITNVISFNRCNLAKCTLKWRPSYMRANFFAYFFFIRASSSTRHTHKKGKGLQQSGKVPNSFFVENTPHNHTHKPLFHLPLDVHWQQQGKKKTTSIQLPKQHYESFGNVSISTPAKQQVRWPNIPNHCTFTPPVYIYIFTGCPHSMNNAYEKKN